MLAHPITTDESLTRQGVFMNWYKHYMGDFAKATAHLTILEHGAYRLLLDHYYATESPLPPELDRIFRITGAFEKHEREAVMSVLQEFFWLDDVGYRHDRADEEITKYTVQAERNREVGKLGGRPKKNPSGYENKTKVVSKTKPKHNPNQIPDTRGQKPDIQIPEWVDRNLWKEWMSIRVKKKAVNSPTALKKLINKLTEIKDSGRHTPTEAMTLAIEESWKSIELEWMDNRATPKKGNGQVPSWKDEKALEAFGKQHGIYPKGAESYYQFHQRIVAELSK